MFFFFFFQEADTQNKSHNKHLYDIVQNANINELKSKIGDII